MMVVSHLPQSGTFFSRLDRPSLILWCMGGYDVEDIDRIDNHPDHIKVWFHDSRMANLTIEDPQP